MEDFEKLLDAIGNGKEEVIKLMLDSGVAIDVGDKIGNTALIVTAKRGYLDGVKTLLDLGANVSAENIIGETCLDMAIQEDNKEMVQVLLERGAKIGACDSDIHTSHARYEERVRKLVRSGVDASYKIRYCKSPICLAIENSNLQILNLLLSRTYQEMIQSHFRQAIRSKNVDVVQTFINNGAEMKVPADLDNEKSFPMEEEYIFSAVETGVYDIVRLLIDHGCDINAKGGCCNDTVLHLVSRNENEKIVKLLLELGANVHAENDYKETALYIATSSKKEKCVKLLLDAGASPNVKHLTLGHPVLHAAVGSGNEKIVKLLIDSGANIFTKNDSNSTVLHEAVCSENENLIKLFLDLGVDLHAKDKNGYTALHLAAIRGNEKIVKILLDFDKNFNERIADYETALHEAARKGSLIIINWLMDLGVNIHAKDKKGKTVLHAAARGPNASIVKLFIDRGVDIAAKNYEGETALHVAAENENGKIIKTFLDHGVDVFAKNEKGNSVLHSATSTGNEYLRFLLQRIGFDKIELYTTSNIDLRKNIYRPDGWQIIFDKLNMKTKTELELSADNYFKTIEELLVYGADVNAINNDRDSALNIALKNKTTLHSVVQLLLDYHANIDNPNKSAFSSLSNDSRHESKAANALVQHQVKLQSEINWSKFVQSHNSKMSEKTSKSGDYSLLEFFMPRVRIERESGEEIMRLKDQMFKDSTISYYDFWTTKDLNQLAAYARNDSIVNELTSDSFKSSFPRYAISLYNTLRKGMWRKRMMDRVSVFFHAFTKEKGNESIPRLPKCCIDVILLQLSNKDLRVLIGICNPRDGFDVEIDSFLGDNK